MDRRSPPTAPVPWIAITALLAVVLAVAACTGGDPTGEDSSDRPAVPADSASPQSVGGSGSQTSGDSGDVDPSPESPPAVITLAITDSTGSRVVSSMVEQLVERRLRHPVELVAARRISDLFADLQDGTVHAALEVWPSTLGPDETAMIDDGRVIEVGPLGVDGKIGWFVPRSVIEDRPELAEWKGYAGPQAAALFATGVTAPSGRFLGTDPGYAQFDEELIESMGLDFVVDYSGSEAATIEAMEAAVAADQPIVAYWWTPTAQIEQFDLVEVALPPRTEACLDSYRDGGLMSCDYPVEPLIKVASPDLVPAAPAVARLIEAVALSTDEQIELIHDVEVEGMSIPEAAARWIEANQSRWEPWVEGS